MRNPGGGMMPPGLMGSPVGAPMQQQVSGIRQMPPPPPMMGGRLPPPPRGQFGHMIPPQFPVSYLQKCK